MSRSLLVAFAALIGVACDPPADTSAERAYAAAMQAQLDRNDALLGQMQGLAAAVKSGNKGAADVAAQLEALLPEARSIAADTAAIDPGTEALTAVHPLIVEAWEARVTAYEGTLAAWTAGDPEAAAEALAGRYSGNRLERRYLHAANEILLVEGYTLPCERDAEGYCVGG